MNGVHALVPLNEQELLAFVLGGAALPVQASRLSEQDRARRLHPAVLLLALVADDPHLSIHSRRVRLLTHHLVRALHLAPDEAMPVELAALVHDIGKLAIPAEVLQKASCLTHEEFAHIKQHPAYGAVILRQMGMPSQVRRIVYHHHERWDGSGYPAGLRGETIPLGARIVTVADAFEAMTSHWPYQAPCTLTQALEELRRCAGTQFDPVLVEHFCASLDAGLPGLSPFVPGRCAGTDEDEVLAVFARKRDDENFLS